ncbi:TPA: L-rhamnose isomerase [Aeromonas hydrophila]|uniref:L-rhamnose isomerase n=1 Tax=Aeromonas hydrophila TaxID=644 RepID=UPI00046564E1|nr:L-rhamnose isomerase [Aeromonas hydrophila]MDE8811346.1 L-rhamnose isomerase [Aeromonas hydrophila]BDC83599.1 L-rhamnose isomerase [Aeromonas hydrophila]HAT2492012.1 L-rhamnose isomerase [Aeromonas hydrophila]HAT2496758.1 L-rhamnose isomerase [Aeromonas hydrophila]HAT2512202.1 L-rhamnose isomerase [Aeromonas hydrophila]
MNPNIETAFALAKQQYAALGVDVDQALTTLATIPVSMHCWQGDDVGGFEADAGALTGGIQATGNYPGKARDAIELRRDLDLAMSLIPGAKRLNLHAIYLEAESPVARDKIEPKHFANWVRWAKERGVGLGFNPSCFSHPLSADGMTLSHPDPEIRRFWIDHCKASRRISASFGQALGTPSVMNIWIPDGMKDLPADRLGPRQRLMAALDEVLAERIDEAHHIDAVESKLFGIGAESYTVGSNEFYLGYASSRDIALCLDAGHFHPTEVISDKISAVSLFVRHLLLHVSRPVRWDSDHVVLLDDETQAIANEIIRNELLERVHIGLDFFDASINRIAAWVIGTRNMKKALLRALLEPIEMLRQAECKGDYSTRLALMEETRSLPWQAVWDYACAREGVAVGVDWLDAVKEYEVQELLTRR